MHKRKDRLKAVEDHRPDDLADRREIVGRPRHQVADAVSVKIPGGLVDQCGVKILPHIKLDMTRSVDQQTPLEKQKDAAHQIDAEDDERIINDLFAGNAQREVVYRLAHHVRNEQPERHRAQNEKDPGEDRPFIWLEVLCEFS